MEVNNCKEQNHRLYKQIAQQMESSTSNNIDTILVYDVVVIFGNYPSGSSCIVIVFAITKLSQQINRLDQNGPALSKCTLEPRFHSPVKLITQEDLRSSLLKAGGDAGQNENCSSYSNPFLASVVQSA
ncbi:hypothetical protein CDAR_56231 [Caerostris darwini]|uniref:Uncharacterized protein n=1 Tax=Caerostris darwini TaxID=1538125 RepID=A0AAV4RTI7_9ARAC|nr:hypothetical protein CDAR_56231 [Caerostris darwini]